MFSPKSSTQLSYLTQSQTNKSKTLLNIKVNIKNNAKERENNNENQKTFITDKLNNIEIDYKANNKQDNEAAQKQVNMLTKYEDLMNSR